MTVGQLRASLHGIADETEVYFSDSEGGVMRPVIESRTSIWRGGVFKLCGWRLDRTEDSISPEDA